MQTARYIFTRRHLRSLPTQRAAHLKKRMTHLCGCFPITAIIPPQEEQASRTLSEMYTTVTTTNAPDLIFIRGSALLPHGLFTTDSRLFWVSLPILTVFVYERSILKAGMNTISQEPSATQNMRYISNVRIKTI